MIRKSLMKFVLRRELFYLIMNMECNSRCYLLFRESSVCNSEVIMFGCLLNHARMVSSACGLM